MSTLIIKSAEKTVLPLLKALQPFEGSIEIEFLENKPLPAVDDQNKKELEELAQRVLKAVRPTAKQPMRREALSFALNGGDTFSGNFLDLNGDTALRNALGALSKAMRPIFQWEQSPIDRIARRVKHFQKDTGDYLGTRYHPTALGARVRELLIAEGAL